MSTRGFVLAALLGLPATGLLATGGAVSKGAVSLTYGATHWTEAQSAGLQGAEATPSASTIYQTGWWYRVNGVQTREYPLPAPDTETYNLDGTGSAVWNNLAGFGLELHEAFRITDNGGPSATYHSELTLLNHTASPIGLAIFHYLDADAGGTFTGDSGVLAATSLIRFVDGARVVRYEAYDESGSGPSPPHAFAAGNASTLKTRLTDAAIDDLADDGLPFGPGDMAAAYEWSGSVYPGSGWGVLYVNVSVNTPADLVKGDALPSPRRRNNFSDILFRRPSDNSMLWWDLEGTQVVTSGGSSTPPSVPVAVDDFNGDRASEIVYQNPATGQVTFGAYQIPLTGASPLPLNWRIVATADFGGDGRPDILWRNTTSQRLVIWTMNGTTKIGNLTPNPDHAVDANWEVVGAADMNGDGKTDFVWYNRSSGRAVIWYLDAFAARTGASFTTPMAAGDANWRVVAVGDWGKGSGAERPAVDGANDLLWRNATTGRLVIWHMNLAAQRTSGGFTSPDAPYQPLDIEVVGPR